MSAAALVISDAAKLPNASLQAAIAAANAAEAILRGRFFFSKSKKRYAYKKNKEKNTKNNCFAHGFPRWSRLRVYTQVTFLKSKLYGRLSGCNLTVRTVNIHVLAEKIAIIMSAPLVLNDAAESPNERNCVTQCCSKAILYKNAKKTQKNLHI